MKEHLRFLFRAWAYRLRDDPAEIAALRRSLGAGDVALDVGAHKGGYLYWMRRAVGTGGRVVGFEPQPTLASMLERRRAHLRWSNVTIENLGVSSAPGRLELIVPGGSGATSPGATFEKAMKSEPHETHAVDVVTIDAYAERAGLSRVDLIKIDVEGHEREVFRGAGATLDRFGPTVLMECEQRHLDGFTPADVFAELLDRGYEGTYFGSRGMEPIDAFDPARDQKADGERFWEALGYVNNFLFTKT